MKKRILSLLLALVLVIGLLPVTAQAEALDNGLQYKVYEDHVEITGYSGDATELVIPPEIEAKPVTIIRPGSLGYAKLTRLTIPGSVPTIYNENFRFSHIEHIILCEGVATIADGAFSYCEGLTSIIFPSSISWISGNPFYKCNRLTEILVAADNPSYTSIEGVLYNKAMTRIIAVPYAKPGTLTIPATVTQIKSDILEYCTELSDYYVEAGNTKFASLDGILYSDDMTHLLRCPIPRETVSIPNGVTAIGNDAAGTYSCASAFDNCVNLTSITLGPDLSTIGEFSFYRCNALTSIDVSPDNDTYISFDNVLYTKDMSTLVFCPMGREGSFNIPSEVNVIGDYSFDNCTLLNGITIPESVYSIGSYAFHDCNNLDTVYFEGKAPEFGQNVFAKQYYNGEDDILTVYYPSSDPTWTEDVMQDYGNQTIWIPYNPGNPFTDVPVDSFYEAPVLWALENGITTGASETSFNPNGQCLRAQVVTFLHRAAENPQPASAANPFTDVKPTDFFYKPVLWAVEEGITNGVSATEFGSYAVCNRAAVVTFLWRAAGSPEPTSTTPPFTDVKTTDFFYKPVLWAIENGITNGISATEFGPTADCNRAQVVTFLYRAYN